MFLVIHFLSRKLLSLIRMVSTSEAIVWKTIFVRILNGFQDEDRKNSFFDFKISQTTQLWKEVPYCSNWTYS